MKVKEEKSFEKVPDNEYERRLNLNENIENSHFYKQIEKGKEIHMKNREFFIDKIYGEEGIDYMNMPAKFEDPR
jgi:hypothetical protein